MYKILVPVTSLVTFLIVALMVTPAGAPVPEPVTSSSDQYLFARDADIAAPLHGNLQVYFGNAYIHAPVDGDVLVVGGDVTLRDPGLIRGDLITMGGTVNGAEGRVRGHRHSPGSMEGMVSILAPATTESLGTLAILRAAIKLSLLFLWLIVAILLTLASGREIRISSVEVRASALHCFVVGLVAFTSFLITAVAFSYLAPYAIGLPLLAALTAFAILTKIYGTVAVFHTVGTLIARKGGADVRSTSGIARWLRGDLAMVVIGLLALGLLRMIPVAGNVVWQIASVMGVGVALTTRFGRREPWFLAWRPSEA